MFADDKRGLSAGREMTPSERLRGNKERMLSFMRAKGPSLPVRLANEIGVSPLFASAFLSELKSEGKVKMSNMRVGSSPLYYLSGQEHLLEDFVHHLNQREGEAFKLLKEKGILEDSRQSPIVRVALRAIKDFASHVKIRVGGDTKIFWKHAGVSDSEAEGLVKKSLAGTQEFDKGRSLDRRGGDDRKKVLEKKLVSASPISIVEKIVKKKEMASPVQSSLRENVKALPASPGFVKSALPKKKTIESEFSRNVKDYLAGKDIEITEVFGERKRDFEGRIRIDTLFGKQEFYLIAKDKKSITDNDFAVALQKAQAEKLPAAVMSTGELNKKGKEHLAKWGNLVKWEKLRF